MSTHNKIILLVFLSIFLAGIANAITINIYEEVMKSKNENSKQAFTLYIKGVGDGFFWSNASLRSNNQKPLFCLPDNLTLNAYNYIQILDEELADSKDFYLTNNTPIAFILFNGLIKTFPCK